MYNLRVFLFVCVPIANVYDVSYKLCVGSVIENHVRMNFPQITTNFFSLWVHDGSVLILLQQCYEMSC